MSDASTAADEVAEVREPQAVATTPAAPVETGAALSPYALPPVSADDPCGPDLDLEGDPDYLNFFAATEGVLPASYYAFKRDAIEFPAAFKTVDALLQRTLDVRLLILGAKLAILNRNLEGFAARVGSIAWMIAAYWDESHPRAEGGDFGLRVGQLETLDDGPVVLMPLQYAPLIEASRQGVLSYRDHLVATGAAQPRVVTRLNLQGETEISADEKFMAPAAIDRLLRDVELEKLVGLYETVRGLAESVAAIRETTKARGGLKATVKLEKLDGVAKGMAEFLRAAVVARDPSLAPAAAGEAGTAEPGAAADGDAATAAAGPAVPAAFATLAEVDAALASAHGYFLSAEPTSPAVLLIRQARQCLGKNLYEVMQLLAPSAADEARVFVGPDGAFPVPVRNLADAPTAGDNPSEAEPAATRQAAVATIDAVVQHMQKTQPSSPIPYLLERAKALATRDFVSLLNDILPEELVARLKRRE